ncbi:unnamed protein product, partial [Mesorhabditis spiculigera]
MSAEVTIQENELETAELQIVKRVLSEVYATDANRTEFTRSAEKIHRLLNAKLNEMYPGAKDTWAICVGEKFGICATFERKGFVFASVNDVSVVMFRMPSKD